MPLGKCAKCNKNVSGSYRICYKCWLGNIIANAIRDNLTNEEKERLRR